jgi:hypothetical protein
MVTLSLIPLRQISNFYVKVVHSHSCTCADFLILNGYSHILFDNISPLQLIHFFFSMALQSLKDIGRLTYRRFLELFRHMVGLLGRVISPSQGLYLHRTTQHRKTRTNIHALSGIRTHNPSNQPVKTHASDRTATVTSAVDILAVNNL